MLNQKSDDGPHIAVKTQCNSTPNGIPQFTLVPLQDWAVFIIPSSYNLHISPLSNTIPIRSVTSEDSFKLFTAASTTVMLCGLTQQNCSNVTYICTTSDTI